MVFIIKIILSLEYLIHSLFKVMSISLLDQKKQVTNWLLVVFQHAFKFLGSGKKDSWPPLPYCVKRKKEAFGFFSIPILLLRVVCW